MADPQRYRTLSPKMKAKRIALELKQFKDEEDECYRGLSVVAALLRQLRDVPSSRKRKICVAAAGYTTVVFLAQLEQLGHLQKSTQAEYDALTTDPAFKTRRYVDEIPDPEFSEMTRFTKEEFEVWVGG